MRVLGALVLTAAATAFAQAPVETGRVSGEQLQRDQYKAGAAYRELQNAERASSDADFEHRRTEAAHKDLQKRTEEARAQVEAAKKKLDAAKAREAQARKGYEAALNAVDRDANPPRK